MSVNVLNGQIKFLSIFKLVDKQGLQAFFDFGCDSK
jgi:hypothetical protein